MRNLILVLGDQLDHASAAFDGFDSKNDVIWMAEVEEETTHVWCHKLRIALKELRETRCWIRLIIKADLLPEARIGELLIESEELCNIIGQSILTATRNSQKQTSPDSPK